MGVLSACRSGRSAFSSCIGCCASVARWESTNLCSRTKRAIGMARPRLPEAFGLVAEPNSESNSAQTRVKSSMQATAYVCFDAIEAHHPESDDVSSLSDGPASLQRNVTVERRAGLCSKTSVRTRAGCSGPQSLPITSRRLDSPAFWAGCCFRTVSVRPVWLVLRPTEKWLILAEREGFEPSKGL
jgi:hypothetical protein